MAKDNYKKTVVGMFLLLGSLAAGAEQNSFSLTSGFDYSTGKYGTDSATDILYIPLIAKYETPRLTYKLTVPYISIKSAGGVVGGDGSPIVIGAGSGGARTTQSGLGDIVGAVSYTLFEQTDSSPLVDITGKIKFATADENKGLGTGENDYTVQADVYRTYGAFTPFGTLGYKVLGDTPTTNFNNVLFGSLGGGYKINQQTSSGLILDLREAATSSGSPQRDLTAYVSHKLTSEAKIQGYVG
ncbi:MAG TPA: hypothetical protein VJM76_01040, partial [Gammaproteobacteria bacterium]|nr:hypothetical protein [Gammaproteobacteria bacterium]